MPLPLRIDIAGGWLDVPRFAVPGAYIVNVAISPRVNLWTPTVDRQPVLSWEFGREVPRGSGLGSSAAWHILNGHDVDAEESAQGCGWQDAEIIRQTGLVVWASGSEPVIAHRDDGQWLRGLMALYWTGKPHDSASLVERSRDFNAIARASHMACKAVMRRDVPSLADAIDYSYEQQSDEGMAPLPTFGLAAKYCGAGHGGYAMYLFETPALRNAAVAKRGLMAVEPYCK